MDFLKAYRKSLTDLLQEQLESLASGGCASWDDYKYKVGVRRGINFALNRFDDVVKEYVKEEREDLKL